MTVYLWLIVLVWAAFIGYWAVSAFSAKRNVGNPWMRSGLWLRVAVLIGVLILLRTGSVPDPAAYQVNPATHPVASALGIVLAALGIAFAIWARYHLGKNWGMPMSIKESPELVTSGPYAYVRHPIYTGVILAIIGTALVLGGWWLIVLVICCFSFIYSAVREEKTMLATFPDQYPAYAKRTKMLVPFVF